MNWPTIKLIFRRELRDQLRDRRTLFTVAIMNRGVILAEGTPTYLAEKHEENDMEELFYQLISRSEAQLESKKNAAADPPKLASTLTN